MIVDRYHGNTVISAKTHIIEFFEKNYPTIYEKYLLKSVIKLKDMYAKPIIDASIKRILSQNPFPIFEQIEIETINRCNLTCSFCPVNKKVDPRPFKLMEYDLFSSIIEQLKELGYSGSIALHSNNEPLLDSRIVELSKLAKESLPNARLLLYTNGTLLTIEKFKSLMKYLDLLVIDNYNDNLHLIKPVQKVYDYCLNHSIICDKVQIHLRKSNEMLTTRGGQSKNRTKISPLSSSCVYPFKQMVVRPDGKVSLCCNDALGRMTLGDLTKNSIVDVWNSDAYWKVRKSIVEGRKNLPLCSGCDTLPIARYQLPWILKKIDYLGNRKLYNGG